MLVELVEVFAVVVVTFEEESVSDEHSAFIKNSIIKNTNNRFKIFKIFMLVPPL